MLGLFEKGPGIIKESIAKLYKLVSGIKDSDANIITFEHFQSVRNATFYKYDLNIYETPRTFKIKPFDFIETLEFNLVEINSLQLGNW